MWTISAWRAYKACSSFCSSHRYLSSRLALLLMCCASTLYVLSPETSSDNSQAIWPHCCQENKGSQCFGNTLATLTNNGWLTNGCHQCPQELVGSSLCFVQVCLKKQRTKSMVILHYPLEVREEARDWLHTSTQSMMRWLLAWSCSSRSSCLVTSSPDMTFFLAASFESASPPRVNSTFCRMEQRWMKVLEI